MSQITAIRERLFPTSAALIAARESLIAAEPFMGDASVVIAAAELRAAIADYAALYLVSQGVMRS